MSERHAAPAHCRRNGCAADPADDCATCPIALAAEPLLRASHKRRREGTASDRPPVGLGDEPGCLLDSYPGEG